MADKAPKGWGFKAVRTFKENRGQPPVVVISQFSTHVSDFSSQYGSETNNSYTASNLAGHSQIFPKYGDFTEACVFRTYGPFWRLAPSGRHQFKRTPPNFISEDYIELTFATDVYPCKIDIWETYNCGTVVRILACDSSGTNVDKGFVRWKVLWDGDSQKCERKAKVFSPELEMTNFKTNVIRLELCHTKCNYYTELDCVTLYGAQSFEPNLQQAVKKSVTSTTSNITAESIMTVIQSNTRNLNRTLADLPQQNPKVKDIPEPLKKDEKEKEEISQEFKDKCATKDGTEENTNGQFDRLPDAVVQLILSYLDIPSLCKACRTSKLLHKHCYDSLQYRELDLQPHWTRVNDNTLRSLHTRCKYLQKLNLSWCGGSKGSITVPTFAKFLEACGQELTSLYLSSCKFVNTSAIEAIAKHCPKLTELDLASCTDFESFAISKLVPIKTFTRLNLYRTLVSRESLIEVIKVSKNLQHLNLGSCSKIDDFEEVAKALAANCKDLRSLDVWRSKNFADIGLQALSTNCPNLEELDLGWCAQLKSGTKCFVDLVKRSPNLKKLFLTSNRTVCDDDLYAIAKHCPKLEQLDILGTGNVSPDSVYGVLQSCPKLILLDVSFCDMINPNSVRMWIEEFPHCNIKKSFQD